MAAGGGANAARFVASFDPLFNLEFNDEVGANVGWRGTALIDVDDSCLTAGIHFVGAWSTCEAASLESGTLDFYNIDNNTNIVSLSWIDGPPEIVLVKIDSSLDLAGIHTLPGVKFDDVNMFGEKWDIRLDFTLNEPKLTVIEDCDHKSSHKSKFKCRPEVFRSGRDGEVSQPQVTWSRVPEPSSFVLLGVALAPLAWVRRRRSKA